MVHMGVKCIQMAFSLEMQNFKTQSFQVIQLGKRLRSDKICLYHFSVCIPQTSDLKPLPFSNSSYGINVKKERDNPGGESIIPDLKIFTA